MEKLSESQYSALGKGMKWRLEMKEYRMDGRRISHPEFDFSMSCDEMVVLALCYAEVEGNIDRMCRATNELIRGGKLPELSGDGNILAAGHEYLITAYLEDYMSRSDWIGHASFKGVLTLCTDLIAKSVPSQLVVFSIWADSKLPAGMEHIEEVMYDESFTDDLKGRSFPLCYKALQQCDEKLENLLKELEQKADSRMSFLKNGSDLLARIAEDAQKYCSRRLRRIKMRRNQIRKTIKEVSKRGRLIKANETKSNLRSALSLQLNNEKRKGNRRKTPTVLRKQKEEEEVEEDKEQESEENEDYEEEYLPQNRIRSNLDKLAKLLKL